MQYGRTEESGIQYLCGVQAREALGSNLKGSYNTFLGQDCRLLLANSTDNQVSVELDMTRYDGTRVLIDTLVSVPAQGLADFPLCAQDTTDVYGVVTVFPEIANSIVATVIREGENDDYRFPTPVRQ